MAVAGSFISILEPRTKVALPGTKLPAMGLDLDATWPTGWIPIQNTANGVQLTFVNPHQDITSDENGVIATVPSGADTINATWQSRTPEENLLKWIGGLALQVHLAAPQIETLTVTGGATASASVTVTLINTGVSVPVLSGDTAAVVAGKIRAATFTGWTVSGTGASVIFTQTTPARIDEATNPNHATFAPSTTGVVAAFSADPTQHYTPTFDEYYLDPSEKNEFMVGIEGEFEPGTLREEGGIIRVFFYNAQQTDNPQFALRKTGSDGLLQPVATVRALPGDVTPLQLAGTGITKIDPKKRFSWFYR